MCNTLVYGLQVKPTDYMLVAALTEDDFSHLEVHLFTEDGTLFVHHDINLPELPLCLAWLDCPPFRDPNGTQTSIGNYIAVGSFDPAIEIWNLDVLDPLEPSAVLGGKSTSWEDLNQKKKKSDKGSKQKLKQAYKLGSHEDAVMSLSWNRVYRQALASGSADSAVKIWDITTQTCSHTFTHHTDKVSFDQCCFQNYSTVLNQLLYLVHFLIGSVCLMALGRGLASNKRFF